MREIILSELVKDVLGPRGGLRGIREQIRNDPMDEFVTGVLSPIKDLYDENPDNTAVIPAANLERTEFQADFHDTDVDISSLLSPALDPKKRPSTMGISFLVNAKESINLIVCITWARYLNLNNDAAGSWQREPRYAVIERKMDLKNSETKCEIDYMGEEQKRPEIQVNFLTRSENTLSDSFFVSIFVINKIRKPEDGASNSNHHIFQPQIRVVCGDGTKIIPRTSKRITDDEKELDFLYRNKPFLARGHLTSAVWKEIDPERHYDGSLLDFPDAASEPPFKWVDGETLPDEERKKFVTPDVRTEYVPIYHIPAPEIELESLEDKPLLDAAKLSELWEPSKLYNALIPLHDSYKKWIDQLDANFEDEQKQIAEGIINECRTVLSRIKLGIDIIANPEHEQYDRDATLAFCFANMAIHIQATWKGWNFKYRPFQLGFLLMCLESVVNKKSKHREVCDLMWVPTGTGKTEAYLALALFTIAYRRRVSLKNGSSGAGVSVLTRYTLRLLTIQQFRRTLSAITAAEFLRVHNLSSQNCIGWRPTGYPANDNLIWGSTPFTVGLWIGSSVTPNQLETGWEEGAIEILTSTDQTKETEPAQILECPACGKDGILAIPSMGLERDTEHLLHFVVRTKQNVQLPKSTSKLSDIQFRRIHIHNTQTAGSTSPQYQTISISLTSQDQLKSQDVNNLWEFIKQKLQEDSISVERLCAAPSRPGYFICNYNKIDGDPKPYDFEIFCPNPRCKLHVSWCGGSPNGKIKDVEPKDARLIRTLGKIAIPDGNVLVDVLEPFQNNSRYLSDRIPIPAYTVDRQIYRRLPTIVIATSDKFARPPFEPRAAGIFGNVEFHHNIHGYYRLGLEGAHLSPAGRHNAPSNWTGVSPLDPPELVLQDELHLIEGPLGSMVGFYETALDHLCGGDAKYLASTATIKRAKDHVQSLFARKLQIFPPYGLTADDRFFIKENEIHPLSDQHPGRLYVGIIAQGRGPLTPLIRIWSRLTQTAWEHRNDTNVQNIEQKIDPFWTITGYFNAVRELAGAVALYRQDIKDRLRTLSGVPRVLEDDNSFELSGRTSSTDLPGILGMLEKKFSTTRNNSPDALFTTSMFGTGVDVTRLGLMMVNGQPKTTSSYIQATGRVGRSRGALVVTFYRSSRPRDLSHYEFFCRHHIQIHRFVEPPTVYPFAPALMDRAIGPVGVYILRNMRNPQTPWSVRNTATAMAQSAGGYGNQEVVQLRQIMQDREHGQPEKRKSKNPQKVAQRMASAMELWQSVASNNHNLEYYEIKDLGQNLNHVVLGDDRHQYAENISVVYKNAPQSLRDLEEETGFKT